MPPLFRRITALLLPSVLALSAAHTFADVPPWFEAAEEARFLEELRGFVRREGSLETLVTALEEHAAAGRPMPERFRLRYARVCRIEGHLDRVHGILDGLASAEADAERAEVYDLLGDARAVATYRALANRSGAPGAGRAALRLFGLLLDRGAVEEARELAGDLRAACPENERSALSNRLAREAALYGAFGLALDLERPAAQSPRGRYLEGLQRALWMDRAGRSAVALGELDELLELAPTRREKRYVLGLEVAVARRCLEGTLIDIAQDWERRAGEDVELLHAALGVYRETLDRERALALLERDQETAGLAGEQAAEVIKLLIEMGAEERAEALLRKRLAERPDELALRVELARWLLQTRRRDAAAELFDAAFARFRAADPARPLPRSSAVTDTFQAAVELGLHETVARHGDRLLGAAIPERMRADLGVLLAEMDRKLGRIDAAIERLDRLRRQLANQPALVLKVAEAFERLGLPRKAVEAYEIALAMRHSDSVMLRLGWLLSEVGEVEEALAVFEKLWRAAGTDSIRRQAAEQLLTLAASLGRLGDLAVDLEEELDRRPHDEATLALLVQLYTRAKDGETVEELLAEFDQAAGGRIAALRKMAEVYLELDEYRRYEETLNQLLELDPDSAEEILMALAMSALERGHPRDARAVLEKLLKITGETSLSHEFAGGVYEIVAEHERAANAYRRALAGSDEHIETLLLWARALSQAGQRDRALHGLLDRLGEDVPDDLFTVAVDGLLNLEARGASISAAARRIRARLSENPRKMFLYELLTDMEEALGDKDRAARALEDSLVVAGERRSVLLRELFERRVVARDGKRAIETGYLLLSLREQQPPHLYLDLGKLLVEAEAYEQAEWVFSLARDAENYVEIQLDVAAILRSTRRLERAERVYRGLLVERPDDPQILLLLAGVLELRSQRQEAGAIYRDVAESAIARLPQTGRAASRNRAYARNLSEFQRSGPPAIDGALASFGEPPRALAWLARVRELTLACLAEVRALPEPPRGLDSAPRLKALVELCARLAYPYGAFEALGEIEAAVLEELALPSNEINRMLREHLESGDLVGYRNLVERCTERRLVEPAQLQGVERIRKRIELSGGEELAPKPSELALYIPWFLLEGRVAELEKILDAPPPEEGEAGEGRGADEGGTRPLSDRDRLRIELALGREEQARAVLDRQLETLLASDGKRIWDLRNLLAQTWDLLPEARRIEIFEGAEELVRKVDKPNTSHCQILVGLARGLDRPLRHEDWWLKVVQSNEHAINSAVDALPYYPVERRVELLVRGIEGVPPERYSYQLRKFGAACAGVEAAADLERLREIGASFKITHPSSLAHNLQQIALDPPADMRALSAILEGVVRAHGVDIKYALPLASVLRCSGLVERAREIVDQHFVGILGEVRRPGALRLLISMYAPDALDELQVRLEEAGAKRPQARALAAELALQRGQTEDAEALIEDLMATAELPEDAQGLADRQAFYTARGMAAPALACVERRVAVSAEALRSVASQIADLCATLHWPHRGMRLLAGDRNYTSLMATLRLAAETGESSDLLEALRDYIQFRRDQVRGRGAVIYLGNLPQRALLPGFPASQSLLAAPWEEPLEGVDLLELAMRTPARGELLSSFFWTQFRNQVRFGQGPSPFLRGMALEVCEGGPAGDHFRERLERNPWDRGALRVLSAVPPDIELPGREELLDRFLKLELAFGSNTFLERPEIYRHRLERVDPSCVAAFIRWSAASGQLGRSYGNQAVMRHQYRFLRELAVRRDLGPGFVARALLASWRSPFAQPTVAEGLLREMARDLDPERWLDTAGALAVRPQSNPLDPSAAARAITVRMLLASGELERARIALDELLDHPRAPLLADLSLALPPEGVAHYSELALQLTASLPSRVLDRFDAQRALLVLAWRLHAAGEAGSACSAWEAGRGLLEAPDRLLELELAWELGERDAAFILAGELAAEGVLPWNHITPWAERCAARGPIAEMDFLAAAVRCYGIPELHARYIRHLAAQEREGAPEEARAALERILAEWPENAELVALRRELEG